MLLLSLVEDIGYHLMVAPVQKGQKLLPAPWMNSWRILEQLSVVSTRSQLTKAQTAASHSLSTDVSRGFSYFPRRQFSLNSPGNRVLPHPLLSFLHRMRPCKNPHLEIGDSSGFLGNRDSTERKASWRCPGSQSQARRNTDRKFLSGPLP